MAIDSELYMEFFVEQRHENTIFQYLVPATSLTNTNKTYLNGQSAGTSTTYATNIVCNKTNITNNGFVKNASGVIADTIMTVYGRR